jgi:hypothetical protein
LKTGDINLPEHDFLHFLYLINIINKNYQYLSEYRIKGWILDELITYCNKLQTTRNVDDHIDSVRDKYVELFAPPVFLNVTEAEQLIIDDIFNKHSYADKFFISLEFYLENPYFFKTQFMSELVRAMKDYESKIIKF